ncbi:MAG: site-2 protease family protein [Candidatus Acidiferrales bacterium]
MARDSGIRIGRILGIPIYLHPSWFIIFALITFSLATQFANQHPRWSQAQHWSLGVLTSLLFFGSVLFHELSHSVVALHYRIPVASITLFVFGGVARIDREPSRALQEFNIAVAGPVSSYMLAAGFWLLGRLFPSSEMLAALAGWLAQINAGLATFNLAPGFPLDGGRILRALVWGRTGDYTRATRAASRGGQLLAYVMIVAGIWQSLTSNFVGGLWLAFIGWFLLTAAQESYAQVAIRGALEGLRAADIMSRELPAVGRATSLEEYVHEMLRTGRRCHLVMEDGELQGLMTVHALNRVPREDWAVTSVQAAMVPRAQIRWAAPEEPVLALLERMQNEDINQMPVVADSGSPGAGRVVGIVTRDSILRVIRTRTEMGARATQ